MCVGPGEIFSSEYRPIDNGWLRGTVVENRSVAGKISLSCGRPAADG